MSVFNTFSITTDLVDNGATTEWVADVVGEHA